MREKKKPITPTEAKRNLYMLDVLSGRITEPPKSRTKPIQHEAVAIIDYLSTERKCRE